MARLTFRLLPCLLFLAFAGCSTSEVFKPKQTGEQSNVITEGQTSVVASEGIRIEAQVAREDNGRFRIDLVVDNRSEYTVDFVPGDIDLTYNGASLKPYSTRFLRNWSYQSASRVTFSPNESAYATVAYNAPDGSFAGDDNIEVQIQGITEAQSGRAFVFPKLHFGPGLKNPIPGAKQAPVPNPKTR